MMEESVQVSGKEDEFFRMTSGKKEASDPGSKKITNYSEAKDGESEGEENEEIYRGAIAPLANEDLKVEVKEKPHTS